MKSILIFGAGKSSTCLIEYLAKETSLNNWRLMVADGNLALAQSKLGNTPNGSAILADV